jgi:predicted ATPase
MNDKTIHYLKITNFKSIDSLEIKGLASFSVFAGANGCGKSNFFDALDFIRTFIESGIEVALRSHGRYENIHSEKRKAKYARRFDFEIHCDLPYNDLPYNREGRTENQATFQYILRIHELDKTPTIEEQLSIDGVLCLGRNKDGLHNIWNTHLFNKCPSSYSALIMFPDLPIAQLLRNIKLYRIDPLGAKEPDQTDQDPFLLDRKGHNLASVLNRLEQNENVRRAILDCMELIVPGVEKIQTEHQQIDSKTAVLFKEVGTRRRFPAHMVSDGTIYALCLLVAVLDSKNGYGLTLIEEPERGLHPKAIRELVGLIRQQTTAANPIWMSTHSETVVRQLHLQELMLVDKEDGRTRMKSADSGNITQENLAPLGLDEAWLSNLLGGGIPW